MAQWIVIGRELSRTEFYTAPVEHVRANERQAKELAEILVSAHTFISAECRSERRKYSSKNVKAWLDED
jgi:hypothetical protein